MTYCNLHNPVAPISALFRLISLLIFAVILPPRPRNISLEYYQLIPSKYIRKSLASIGWDEPANPGTKATIGFYTAGVRALPRPTGLATVIYLSGNSAGLRVSKSPNLLFDVKQRGYHLCFMRGGSISNQLPLQYSRYCDVDMPIQLQHCC